MPQSETTDFVASSRLPVVIEPHGVFPGVTRPRIGAAFLTQLIAERDHLPVQSEFGRAPMPSALSAYGESARRGTRRMPAGYRTSRNV